MKIKISILLLVLFSVLMISQSEAYAGVRDIENCRKGYFAPRRNSLSRGSRLARQLAQDARKPICKEANLRGLRYLPIDDSNPNYPEGCILDVCCKCNSPQECKEKNYCCLPRASDAMKKEGKPDRDFPYLNKPHKQRRIHGKTE